MNRSSVDILVSLFQIRNPHFIRVPSRPFSVKALSTPLLAAFAMVACIAQSCAGGEAAPMPRTSRDVHWASRKTERLDILWHYRSFTGATSKTVLHSCEQNRTEQFADKKGYRGCGGGGSILRSCLPS